MLSAQAGSEITFSESDGTYEYNVSGAAGAAVDLTAADSGRITVDGSAVSKMATFVRIYIVNFTETGLPAGTNWSVMIDLGTSSTGLGPAYNEAGGPVRNLTLGELPNGTYAFSVGSVPGYVPTPEDGSITIQGNDVSQSVRFKESSAATFLGLPGMDGYGVLGGAIVVILAVVAAVDLLRRRRRKTPIPENATTPPRPRAGEPPLPP
jgi:hypothetical protein